MNIEGANVTPDQCDEYIYREYMDMDERVFHNLDGQACHRHVCDDNCAEFIDIEIYVRFESYDQIPYTNRDYRVNEINPNMNCSICPPNKGENYTGLRRKSYESKPKKERRTRDRQMGRKLKESNIRGINDDYQNE